MRKPDFSEYLKNIDEREIAYKDFVKREIKNAEQN